MEVIDPITITVPIYKQRSFRSLSTQEFDSESKLTQRLVAIDCFEQDIQKAKDLKLNLSRTLRWLLHTYLQQFG
jgi:hypothetical protein